MGNSHRKRGWLGRCATVTAAAATAAALLAGCAGPADDAGVVTLDFFQFKPEAAKEFSRIIADFEALNPDIRVRQNNVPDPDTAIRTLLVKNKTPDVLTLNGNGNFALLAEACIFADLQDEPAAARIKPAVQEILNSLGTCHGEETNGLPFSNNASGVLYNPEIFARYNVPVPQTWDQLIAAAETFKANGVNPFYITLKDAWTVLPSFVNLAGALPPKDFFEDLKTPGWTPESGKYSFSRNYQEAADKLGQLFAYAQPDAASRGYDAGNQAFAEGKSAMYLQGSFAIPAIRAANPDAKIASFPYPTSNDPAKNQLVSGVDVAVAMGRNTKHPEQSRRFIEYLMSKPVLDSYAQAQSSLTPVLDAAPQEDPALQGMTGLFDAGRVIGYIDHQIPPSLPLPAELQQFVLDGNKDKFLASLDQQWAKISARTIQRDGK